MNMKLLVPKKVIADSDTFSSGKDLLDRENFATDLTDVLTSTSEGLVVGLDAKWGEGKTTFAKLWRNKLKADETKCIYFDAFENDYMSDAFYALTSLIHEIVKKEENRHLFNQLKENLTSLSKVVLKAGLKSGAKVLTENIAVKAGATFVEELDNATTKYIDERFESSESDKKVVENFKVFLSSLHEKLETDKPIVFIIDELDRCRPNYAMEILETIKHFLSVPNISWILVMNRVQLEQSVSHLYGLDKESCHSYLQKFVQLWVTLPQSTGGIANKVTYFRHCLNDMGLTHHYEDDSLEIHLINHYDLSLREIEQVLTNFAILENRFIGGKGFVGNTFPLYLAIIRV
ncbi:MAG: hypothetical protein H8E36_16830, partial [Rhodospirillaceae bacterium]|nr:hypothetical protein [Rhodospirillaceae bacterium]